MAGLVESRELEALASMARVTTGIHNGAHQRRDAGAGM
jgi:hypothetical protein